MSKRFTPYQLRKRASKQLPPIHVQPKEIKTMIRLGILPEPNANPEMDPWRDEAMVWQLFLLADAFRFEDWRFCRRAVRLFLNRPPGYQADYEKLRTAVIETLPTIETPKRKLRRIQEVSAWYSIRFGDQGVVTPTSRRRKAALPPFKEWSTLLQSIDADRFQGIAEASSYTLPLLDELTKQEGIPELAIDWIPSVEKFSLLVLLEADAVYRKVELPPVLPIVSMAY